MARAFLLLLLLTSCAGHYYKRDDDKGCYNYQPMCGADQRPDCHNEDGCQHCVCVPQSRPLMPNQPD